MAHRNKPHTAPLLDGKKIKQFVSDGSIVSGVEVIGDWEWNGKKWIDVTPEPKLDFYQRDMGPAIQSGDGGNLAFIDNTVRSSTTLADGSNFLDLGNGIVSDAYGGISFTPGEGPRFDNPILKRDIHLSLSVKTIKGELFINGELTPQRIFGYFDRQLSNGLTFEVKQGDGISKEKYYLVQEGDRNICLYQTIRSWDREDGIDSSGQKKINTFTTDSIHTISFTDIIINQPIEDDPIDERPIDPKPPEVPITLDTPSIEVSPSTYTYNINSPQGFSIIWKTQLADKVNFNLGKVQKELKPQGELVLGKSDFPNGVGQYTIYLQPVNNDGGSGAYESIVVNVISKAYIPGPDIVTINYPENIIGADFKGYDVDFRIDWSSINTNWINIYAGKVSENTLVAKKQTPQGKVILNIQNVLQAAGRNIEKDADVIDFKLCLVPYNSEADEVVSGKKEEIKIRFDVSNLKLRRNNVIKDIRSAITSTLDKSILKADNSKYLTHILHFGNGENKLISTWDIDRETFSEYEVVNELTGEERKVKEEESLVLKLYEPLGGEIQPNQQVWISKIQSIPIVESLTILNEGDEDCIVLQPNLNDEFTDNVGLQIYDDLISSGSSTSTDIVNQFVSGSGYNLKELDIDFVSQSYSIIENGSGAFKQKGEQTINYKNFVKYSSAEERIENFWYKVKLIEFYNNKLDLVTSGSHYLTSITLRNEKQKIEHQINGVKNGFDAFESFLYTSSSLGGLTYPGAGQNAVSSSTSADGLSWYNSTLGDRFSPSEGTARHYDLYNDSRLVNNLPSHVQNSSEGEEFTLFFDMIGQHFDNIWVYIKSLAESRKLENKQNVGIKDRFLYQMLESLGWDADIGVKSAALWDFAFGKDKDGTQSRATSGKDRQNEVWRRILNNLPYLLKHKGTKRAIHALMSCYGVPTSILTIAEFGGPRDVTQSGTSKFTYEDRTAAIKVSGSLNPTIDVDWKPYNGDHPNSVEIRINTEIKQDHKIISGSNWSLDVIKDTGSLAKVQLTVGSVSASTATFPFFNDEYTQIVVNRTTGSLTDEFTFYAKEGFQERIRNEVSKSLTSVDKSWESGSQISIGGTSSNFFVDEFRLWTTALNEVVIDNHTLLPDAIDGNSPSASSEDLIFRNDFEYPKNRYSDASINNVAITTTYAASSTATNFDNDTTYPYQYQPYDRTVTANVPSSGTSFGNKFRFENQYELGEDTVLNATSSIDLSYRQRSTKKSFDKAPVDTNKLGLFFSPTKEIDLDILKSVGPLNIDDYIGDPADNYNEEYSALKTYREYYFQRYNLNFNEYIQLVRYFDKTLFDQLVTLVPARAKVASGLLLQPHILERSKTKWNRPRGEENYHEATISNTVNNQLSSSISNIDALISASEDVNPTVEYNNIEGHVSESDDSKVTVEIRNYDGTYQSQDDQSLSGTITRNQSSTMGGFEFLVNAQITGSTLASYFQTDGYEQIGMDFDGLSRLGFGLYGKDSYSIRTRFDGRGNLIKDKVRVFKIKESYQEDVIININTNDSSMGTQVSEITKYKDKVVILSQSGSAPTVGGNVTEVTPLDGFFSTHYVNVGDLTSGMENSFFNGSKQTSATTLDGGSPVQTFTTNPNTLRVSDSGRGSGEPILEVD